MTQCEICNQRVSYKDVLRLGDHWYCLSCLAKATEDSHMRKDEPLARDDEQLIVSLLKVPVSDRAQAALEKVQAKIHWDHDRFKHD